ncbi:MAG: YegS/Rv2252/BmrU family lipid kinase [Myxococcota bacterium]
MQNTAEHICLIVNPMAGAGAAGRSLDGLKRALDTHFEQWTVHVTEGPGHASSLAAEAAQAGHVQLVAAVGGDGTCHEVVNGLMDGDAPINPSMVFTVIPFGTGSDLQKSLEVPSKLSGALRVAAAGADRLSDVGLATVTQGGEQRKRHFINVGGFGANGEVVRQVNAGNKALGGRVAFARAALAAATNYSPALVRLRWADADEREQEWEGRLLSCFVGNGAYCGGGMWVGRGGTMSDGRLDLSVIPSTGILRQLVDLRRLYDGHLDRAKNAFQKQITSVHATARQREAVYVDLDGELSGTLPLHFQILPQTLQIRGGWGSGV